MAWSAITLLTVQSLLLLLFSFFSFFAFFNYLYGIASLWRPRIRRTRPSGRKIAVVIVSFNERYVLEDAIRACDDLSYPNKLIVLADDSTDAQVVDRLHRLAVSRGCKRVLSHPFVQEINDVAGRTCQAPIEIWESPEFVLFHRPTNAGFKAGSLQKVPKYLQTRGIELMYLLDSDWHPQKDAERRWPSMRRYHEVGRPSHKACTIVSK